MAVTVIFNAVNVNAQNTNSLVSIGENVQTGWSSHNKNNYGTGTTYGIAWEFGQSPCIIDNDLLDSPITAPNTNTTPQNQQL